MVRNLSGPEASPKARLSSLWRFSVVPATCRSVAANGRPCRCYAIRHSIYCRHHQPKLPPGLTPPQPGPAAERPMTQAEITAGWRFYHAQVRSESDPEALDGDVQIILAALANRQISHRSAGRILQTIEDRRMHLLATQIRRQVILQQEIEALRQAAQTNAKEGAPC